MRCPYCGEYDTKVVWKYIPVQTTFGNILKMEDIWVCSHCSESWLTYNQSMWESYFWYKNPKHKRKS